jgi:predicted negative regulator of RcsB-dependent stress response
MPYRRRVQVKKTADAIVIETWAEKILKGVRERRTPLLVLVGGILLFGTAVTGYYYFSSLTERKAQDMEFSAYSEYSKRTRMSGAEKDKQTQLAIEQYQKILDSYPKTKTAGIAAYYLGNAYLDLKNFDKAIDSYQKALTSISLGEMMRGVIHLRLGYAYLSKNEGEKALSEFAQVAKNPLTRNQDLASLEIGRIYENQGKKSEALSEYESLIKSYPSSPLVGDVTSRISELKGPSVVVSTPGTAVTSPPKKN